MFIMFFFFFSSRRRHTRSLRDWSSDVCSSDLAVRMAAEMRSHIAGLAEKWRRYGHELGFGIGIASGHATLGNVGYEGRFHYSATGTVVNLGSRLCAHATDKQILIDGRVQV